MINVVKTNQDFTADVRSFLTDLALRKSEAAVYGQPFRISQQDRRTADFLQRRLDIAEAQGAAALRLRVAKRRFRRPSTFRYVAEVIGR